MVLVGRVLVFAPRSSDRDSLGSPPSVVALAAGIHRVAAVAIPRVRSVSRRPTAVASSWLPGRRRACWPAPARPRRRRRRRPRPARPPATADHGADHHRGLRAAVPADRPAHGRSEHGSPTRRSWSRWTTARGPGPRSAINQADIVFELLVEGITRFALVYGSQTADDRRPGALGPLQRHRPAGRSGPAAAGVVGRQPHGDQAGDRRSRPGPARSTPAEGANPPEYWRDNTRQAPHNLFTSIPMLLSKFGAGRHLAAAGHRAHRRHGHPAAGLGRRRARRDHRLRRRAWSSSYAWDASGQGLGPLPGRPAPRPGPQRHPRLGGPAGVSPPNLVVLFRPTASSVADPKSPQAKSVGRAPGWCLVDGHQIAINWSRPANTSPYAFTTTDGAPYTLPPGRTWVALPQVGSTVTVLDAADRRRAAGPARADGSRFGRRRAAAALDCGPWLTHRTTRHLARPARSW